MAVSDSFPLRNLVSFDLSCAVKLVGAGLTTAVEYTEAALVLCELKASAAEPLVAETFPSGRPEKGDKGEEEYEEEDHESVPIDLPLRRFGFVCLGEYEQVLHLIKQKSGNARVSTRERRGSWCGCRTRTWSLLFESRYCSGKLASFVSRLP